MITDSVRLTGFWDRVDILTTPHFPSVTSEYSNLASATEAVVPSEKTFSSFALPAIRANVNTPLAVIKEYKTNVSKVCGDNSSEFDNLIAFILS